MNYEKLFETFLASHQAEADDQGIAEYFAERMQEIDNTRCQINKFGKEEEEAETEYQRKLATIQRERAKIQEACPHPSTTYHPDANGWHAHLGCDICGYVW